MKDGYGFGAEGDWKMTAMLRAMKVMATGSPGGNSFMEDYTYHLDPSGMPEFLGCGYIIKSRCNLCRFLRIFLVINSFSYYLYSNTFLCYPN